MTAQKVLSPHHAATVQRMASHDVVLCLQDTSELNYSRQTQTTGLGPLSYENQRGLHLHPTLAVTPDRLCLGVLNNLMWARDEQHFGKRVKRAKKLLEEKESQRWLDGYQQACQLAPRLPTTQLVYVADREGDIYDIFVEYEIQEQPADYLIRVHHDRRLVEGKISEALAQAPILGEADFDLPHSHKRPQKHIKQILKATRVTIPEPGLADTALDSVEVTIILAQELCPPKGQEALTWILVTNRPVETQAQALQMLQWYLCRWQIEVYFRVLKSGCRIEELQLESMERLQPALALYMIVTWRILYLTMLGRECPTMSCDAVFEDEEWQAVYIVTHRKTPPNKPPTLNAMIKMIASFGGYLHRKNDGEPGPQTLWIGLQRMRDFTLAIKATKTMENNGTYV